MMQLTLSDWEFEGELANLMRRLRSPWRLFLHRLWQRMVTMARTA